MNYLFNNLMNDDIRSHPVHPRNFRRVDPCRECEETLKLRQEIEGLALLYTTALEIIEQLELSPLLNSLIKKAGQLLDTQHGFISILNAQSSEMEVITSLGFRSVFSKQDFSADQGLIGTVLREQQTVVIPNYNQWAFRLSLKELDAVVSIAGVPLFVDNRIVGVLALGYPNGSLFTREKIALLERFSKLASAAIRNAQIYLSLQQALDKRN